MTLPVNKLIVVSGPTREWLDPVRFLTNPSSGQTGWELARCGIENEDIKDVIFISGPGQPRYQQLVGAHNIRVETTADMARAVQKVLDERSLLFMAAAPADFSPGNPGDHKIKKESKANMVIELAPTVDILKSLIPLVSDLKHFYRVGFAAETENLEDYAARKLVEKNLDFICANRVFKTSQGFGGHENTLVVLGKDGSREILGPLTKSELARDLMDYILKQISS